MPERLNPDVGVRDGGSAADAPRLRGRREWGRAGVQALLVVVVFALAGLGAAWLWHLVWEPSRGLAFQGRFVVVDRDGFYDLPQLRGLFSATGLLAVVAFPTAVAVGLLTALVLDRHELVTLAAVVVGAVVAAALMAWLGQQLGPPDPDVLARSADDRTTLLSALEAPRPVPYLVWTTGALVGLLVAFVGVAKRGARRAPADPRA
ncbi:hypothetical protein [Nocardioides sp. P86]|uniref:hypothetical protein n=1 Tax=Nocardioides sp. P86 TaxID=2939569 RepID=UPI002041090A|nr:hypothetical protein [Nocardioides sp. P86]MCM3514021.1 hypothetical protein [Nocardioides sp. P86]